jgi:hypothetical protein
MNRHLELYEVTQYGGWAVVQYTEGCRNRAYLHRFPTWVEAFNMACSLATPERPFYCQGYVITGPDSPERSKAVEAALYHGIAPQADIAPQRDTAWYEALEHENLTHVARREAYGIVSGYERW